MDALGVRVIKLGGSLLELPALAARFRAWLEGQTPAVNLLIVGGGPIVESIRTLDRLHGLGDEAAHWLAIRAMGLSAEVVARLLPEAALVKCLNEVELEGTSPQLYLFEVQEFMQDDARNSASPLPASWQVTSDSIAACVAAHVGARELVLLKSALPEGTITLQSLAQSGYVDEYFPQAMESRIPIRYVDLRTTEEVALS